MHDYLLLIFAAIILAINFHIYILIRREREYIFYVLNQWLSYTLRNIREEKINNASGSTAK